jgi:hypothetical protein
MKKLAPGTAVEATKPVRDGRKVLARKGDVGIVVQPEGGEEWATVAWARTGDVGAALPEEVDALPPRLATLRFAVLVERMRTRGARRAMAA